VEFGASSARAPAAPCAALGGSDMMYKKTK